MPLKESISSGFEAVKSTVTSPEVVGTASTIIGATFVFYVLYQQLLKGRKFF